MQSTSSDISAWNILPVLVEWQSHTYIWNVKPEALLAGSHIDFHITARLKNRHVSAKTADSFPRESFIKITNPTCAQAQTTVTLFTGSHPLHVVNDDVDVGIIRDFDPDCALWPVGRGVGEVLDHPLGGISRVLLFLTCEIGICKRIVFIVFLNESHDLKKIQILMRFFSSPVKDGIAVETNFHQDGYLAKPLLHCMYRYYFIVF